MAEAYSSPESTELSEGSTSPEFSMSDGFQPEVDAEPAAVLMREASPEEQAQWADALVAEAREAAAPAQPEQQPERIYTIAEIYYYTKEINQKLDWMRREQLNGNQQSAVPTAQPDLGYRNIAA